jgi:mRNA-degrading endonuclease RelE of RelBE toxin-antitoxin system
MTENTPQIQVLFGDEFKRRLKSLKKRYRQIRTDLQPLIEQIQSGETPGDRMVGTGFTVFKVRVQNSDNRKGKSGGYRARSKARRTDHNGGDRRCLWCRRTGNGLVLLPG